MQPGCMPSLALAGIVPAQRTVVMLVVFTAFRRRGGVGLVAHARYGGCRGCGPWGPAAFLQAGVLDLSFVAVGILMSMPSTESP